MFWDLKEDVKSKQVGISENHEGENTNIQYTLNSGSEISNLVCKDIDWTSSGQD